MVVVVVVVVAPFVDLYHSGGVVVVVVVACGGGGGGIRSSHGENTSIFRKGYRISKSGCVLKAIERLSEGLKIGAHELRGG